MLGKLRGRAVPRWAGLLILALLLWGGGATWKVFVHQPPAPESIAFETDLNSSFYDDQLTRPFTGIEENDMAYPGASGNGYLGRGVTGLPNCPSGYGTCSQNDEETYGFDCVANDKWVWSTVPVGSGFTVGATVPWSITLSTGLSFLIAVPSDAPLGFYRITNEYYDCRKAAPGSPGYPSGASLYTYVMRGFTVVDCAASHPTATLTHDGTEPITPGATVRWTCGTITGGHGPYVRDWSPDHSTASFIDVVYPDNGTFTQNCLITDDAGCTYLAVGSIVVGTGFPDSSSEPSSTPTSSGSSSDAGTSSDPLSSDTSQPDGWPYPCDGPYYWNGAECVPIGTDPPCPPGYYFVVGVGGNWGYCRRDSMGSSATGGTSSNAGTSSDGEASSSDAGTSSIGATSSTGGGTSSVGGSSSDEGTSSGGPASSSDAGTSSIGVTSSSAAGTSSAGGLPTSSEADSTGSGTSEGSSGTSTPSSSGISSTGGGAPTSDSVGSSGGGTSVASSGTTTTTPESSESSTPGSSDGSGEPCCPPGFIWDEVRATCVPGVAVKLVPNTPAVPILVSKTNTLITIQSPVWDDADPRKTPETMEMERVELRLTGETVGTTWDEETDTYGDGFVVPLGVYHYRVRACNNAGCSNWSPALTVSLRSASCVVVLVRPDEDGLEWIGAQALVMTVTDAGGATQQHFKTNGVSLPLPRIVGGGDDEAGTWRYDWQTREALQGPTVLAAWALGSDGLWASDAHSIELVNTMQNAVQITDVGPLTVTDEAKAFRSIIANLETGPLSPIPRYGWWARCGLRTWDIGGTDPLPTPPTTPAQAETQFLTHQLVQLGKGVKAAEQGTRLERRAYYKCQRLAKSAQVVMGRLMLYPRDYPLAFKLAPSTKLVKAREAEEEGVVVVFGTDTASVWTYDGTTVALIKDLHEAGAGNATDAALVGDKIYCTLPDGTLRMVDTTPGDAPYDVRLLLADGAEEPRPARFVERVETAVWVWCVDEDLTPPTRVYKVEGADVTPLMTLEGAVHVTDTAPFGVGMGVDAELWRSSTAGALPTLVHTFPGTITALDRFRVGIDNGAVYFYDGTEWVLDLMVAAPAVGLSAWYGNTDTLHGVAVGHDSAQLYEQGTAGVWAPGRLVDNPTDSGDTVDEVLAMRRHFVTVPIPAEELTGGPGEATTKEVERLMVLTGGDGLLVVYQVSLYTEAGGAVPVSSLAELAIAPGGAKELFEA